MKYVMICLLLLVGCSNNSAPAVTETFDQMVSRTENITCADLTAALPGAPVPACKDVYDAAVSGRALTATIYPAAANIKLGVLSYSQTNLLWSPTEAFPRMLDGGAPGAMGVTLLCRIVEYSFPGVIRHEMTHALTCLLDGQKLRTDEAINDPKDADQKDYYFFYDITCHNTSDDPFGDKNSISISGRASCIFPYNGPKNPLLN